MRKHFGPREARFVRNLNVFGSTCHLGDSYPTSNCVAPANYAALNQCVRFDLGVVKNCRISDSNACAYLAVCPDYHVWPKLRSRVDSGRWMDDYITVLDTCGEQFRLLFFESLHIHTLTNQVVFGLADVHPVARELKLVQLFVRSHQREDFSLD